MCGAGVKQSVNQRPTKLAAFIWLVVATTCSWSTANEPAALDAAYAPSLEPANFQVPAVDAIPPIPPQTVLPIPPQPSEMYIPPQIPAVVPVPTPSQTPTPLLDDGAIEEELTPPGGATNPIAERRGVRPYGGGHPGDWPWGCNGSPFRTGPGFCDTWEVGCRWDVAVDGIVMRREDADLATLAAFTNADSMGNPIDLPNDPMDPLTLLDDPALEQFDYGVGGRVWMTSKLPKSLWQMHFGYEGIEEWNASVVYPKQPQQPLPPPPLLVPEFPSEQRSLTYRSSLHAAELNFVRDCGVVRPYCGVRYIKFDDEIQDFVNQQAAPPLPAQLPAVGVPPLFPPVGPVVTDDYLNLFDIENNLIGFQIGARHDLWRPSRRLAIEGFVNTGVYYNRVKYTNLMGQFTTQEYGDNVNTPLAGVPPAGGTANLDESRLDFADVVNNDVREYDEISYVTEASISGVCRINKCWALRAGYQAMFINNVHLAEDAYLGNDLEGRSLFFHGWHAGVEHRR
jgi:hypothetical protein